MGKEERFSTMGELVIVIKDRRGSLLSREGISLINAASLGRIEAFSLMTDSILLLTREAMVITIVQVQYGCQLPLFVYFLLFGFRDRFSFFLNNLSSHVQPLEWNPQLQVRIPGPETVMV